MNIENQMDSAARHLRKEIAEIPGPLLQHAKGLVFLTMMKGAFLWSGSLATGIVVKKLGPKTWSPPVSVGMASFGFGLQAGGEKVNIIIVIGLDDEIDTFAGTGQLKLGVAYGLAAGPVGRDIDVSAYIGRRGLTCSIYYARSKGAYIGFSLEGAMLLSRFMANRKFYGEKVKVKEVLDGKVVVPEAREATVARFHQVLTDFEEGKLTTRINAGGSDDFGTHKPASSASSASGQLVAGPDRLDEEEQEFLLDMKELGTTGKDLLKYALGAGSKSVVFTADHVVNENDPVCRTYGIIGALKDDTAVLLEGTLESGLGGSLTDYVRVRVNHGGVERTGLVSRFVLKAV